MRAAGATVPEHSGSRLGTFDPTCARFAPSLSDVGDGAVDRAGRRVDGAAMSRRRLVLLPLLAALSLLLPWQARARPCHRTRATDPGSR